MWGTKTAYITLRNTSLGKIEHISYKGCREIKVHVNTSTHCSY